VLALVALVIAVTAIIMALQPRLRGMAALLLGIAALLEVTFSEAPASSPWADRAGNSRSTWRWRPPHSRS